MSRGNWNRIKRSKFFYVRTYRKVLTYIILSQIVNIALCLGIIYSFFHQPIRTYYATSGIEPPIELNPLDTPNYTAKPLLPADPVNEIENKVIPE